MIYATDAEQHQDAGAIGAAVPGGVPGEGVPGEGAQGEGAQGGGAGASRGTPFRSASRWKNLQLKEPDLSNFVNEQGVIHERKAIC